VKKNNNITEDNSLDTREWQLLLVLKELQGQLSEHEKNQTLRQWLEQKIKDLDARTGW
jgi:hypothetical protein|tara:strand:- start:260 stop:433 length:174 start_codon:yes stop_codon:yes gene_type:complete